MIRLENAECIEFMKKLENDSVDLIVTDPPYKIITGGDSNGKNSTRPKGMLSGNRELMKTVPKFNEWLPECYRVLKEGSHAYFMVNFSNLFELQQAVVTSGFQIHNLLVWQKNNNTPSQYYMKNCEYIIFARKGKAKWINDIGGSKTVHQFNNILGNKVHPTEKPVDLMEFYIKNSSNENDIILDPFMGSGSTGIACLNTNRRFIGCELDEGYFEIATKRIQDTLN
jgi:site-specific DNA-methyltransferase (adenine-specific)